MALDNNSFSIFLDTIKRFVDNKLIPREEEVADTNNIPNDIVEEMKNIGLFGISIPTEYGGSNLSMEQEVELTFELGRASPAFRSMAGTNIGIGSQTIVMSGTDEQKNKYLPKFSTGEIIGSFALTEPDSGSDAMSINTTAKKNGNKYIINGTKRYITKSVCFHAAHMANEIKAKAICTLTNSGYTAFQISAWRPESHILVFTHNKRILNRLSLLWGVKAFYYDKYSTTDETIDDINNIAKSGGFVTQGDFTINLAAMPIIEKGMVNTLRVNQV